MFTGARNVWASAEFKGITSVWRTPESSGRAQLFEMQFHTAASFAARQDTFAGYSRLRALPADPAEVRQLRGEQRLAAARVPVPPGAFEIMTGTDARGRGAPAPPPGPGPAHTAPTAYYAIVDSYSAPGEPAGVLRQRGGEDGEIDEEFGADLEWTPSWVRYSWERGNLDAELYEVSEIEASQIIERIRCAAERLREPADSSKDR